MEYIQAMVITWSFISMSQPQNSSLKFHIWSSLYSIWTLHVLDIATGKCQIRMTTTYKMINDNRHVTLILKITEPNVWLFRSDWFEFDVIIGRGIPEAWWECHWILTRFQTLHHNKTEKSPLSSWNICQGEKHKILFDMMIVEIKNDSCRDAHNMMELS